MLSIKRLCDDNNITVTFDDSFVCFKDHKSHEEILTGGAANGLYQLDLGKKHSPNINLGVRAPLSIRHARLGHNNERTTKEIMNLFHLTTSTKCMMKSQACIVGKLHQENYQLRNKNVTSLPLNLVFADVWGPALMVSAFENRFYVLFVDNTTHYNWIFPIVRKSQVHKVFISFTK